MSIRFVFRHGAVGFDRGVPDVLATLVPVRVPSLKLATGTKSEVVCPAQAQLVHGISPQQTAVLDSQTCDQPDLLFASGPGPETAAS